MLCVYSLKVCCGYCAFLGNKLCRLLGVCDFSPSVACWGDRRDSHLISGRQRLVSKEYRVNPAPFSLSTLSVSLPYTVSPPLFLSFICFSLSHSQWLSTISSFAFPCLLYMCPVNKQSLTHVTVVCKIRWNWKRKHYSAGNPVGFLLFSLLSLEICAGVENEAVLEESRKQVPVSFIV